MRAQDKGNYNYVSNSSGAGGNADEFGMDGWGKSTTVPVIHVGTMAIAAPTP